MSTQACDHEEPPVWHLAPCNEDGWHCARCGAALGFRPDLDRKYTISKVDDILLFLHHCDFVYVSNSEMAEVIVANVVERCESGNTRDQWSIIRFIIEEPNMASHAEFWRKEAAKAGDAS
ncbi:MAG: hypothetical protein KGK07_07265 [Chloroflexota bacterium]|nr:hypothetical protein [Chloroflexota bacterium]